MGNLEKTWSERKVSVADIIPFVENYSPSCPVLAEGKKLILETLFYIKILSLKDIDINGGLTNLGVYETAKWFDKNIVQEYFKHISNGLDP